MLQKRTEAQHALARGADVGQDEDNDVLLADAAAALLFPILRLAQLDHRSAASTRGFEVVVSVAVMPTFAALMPVAAQMPCFGSTLGQDV